MPPTSDLTPRFAAAWDVRAGKPNSPGAEVLRDLDEGRLGEDSNRTVVRGR